MRIPVSVVLGQIAHGAKAEEVLADMGVAQRPSIGSAKKGRDMETFFVESVNSGIICR